MTPTAESPTRPAAPGATRCENCSDGLGRPRPVRPGSVRDRVHRTPAVARAWRVGVFLAGLLLVALGVALAVLPGPLTIPPVLAGLWVWSTEFDWARRVFASFARKARDAWQHARRHPVSSAVVTGGGLAAVAAAVWAVQRFDLVDQVQVALGR
ncbi:PGPGW domain-containing protein [Geodermatophilus sp. SYSU D00815]